MKATIARMTIPLDRCTRWLFSSLFLLAGTAWAQLPECPPTSAHSPCDISIELTEAEMQAHPNPYWTVNIHAEFRSPEFKTYLLPAYWDGDKRMVLRFTPTMAGTWAYRVTSNLDRLNGFSGKLEATPSEAPGFIRAANAHHWQYTESLKPHLWMGDTILNLAALSDPDFERYADSRASQKFTHVRAFAAGANEAESKSIFPAPDRVNPAHFKKLDERVIFLNRRGIVVDLILAGGRDHLAKMFPAWQARERFIRYMAGRYSPLSVTWQLVEEFEDYTGGRALLREVGTALKKMDPYQHPRSTHAIATSAPLLDDGWMDYITYQSSDAALGAIEHELYARPQVNAGFGSEDSGAGNSNEFRRRLWQATMNGQYPTFANNVTSGGARQDFKHLDSPGARAMTAWFDTMSRTRWWDLEPYYDIDGGRGLALEGLEYLVYVEKAGFVELLTEKHGYNVWWIDPATGEATTEKKEYKGEKFSAQTPPGDHDWILHLSRDEKKADMLKSYRFNARTPVQQEVEIAPERVPFEMAQPAADVITAAKPGTLAAKLKRETRASRKMLYLWTGEVAVDGQGYRVLATGAESPLKIPASIIKKYPATMSLRLYGLNGVGKLYSLDKIVAIDP